jgi:hypothetical protein
MSADSLLGHFSGGLDGRRLNYVPAALIDLGAFAPLRRTGYGASANAGDADHDSHPWLEVRYNLRIDPWFPIPDPGNSPTSLARPA